MDGFLFSNDPHPRRHRPGVNTASNAPRQPISPDTNPENSEPRRLRTLEIVRLSAFIRFHPWPNCLGQSVGAGAELLPARRVTLIPRMQKKKSVCLDPTASVQRPVGHPLHQQHVRRQVSNHCRRAKIDKKPAPSTAKRSDLLTSFGIWRGRGRQRAGQPQSGGDASWPLLVVDGTRSWTLDVARSIQHPC